jgi:hypothetical protein
LKAIPHQTYHKIRIPQRAIGNEKANEYHHQSTSHSKRTIPTSATGRLRHSIRVGATASRTAITIKEQARPGKGAPG